jgi:hypothetical protein
LAVDESLACFRTRPSSAASDPQLRPRPVGHPTAAGLFGACCSMLSQLPWRWTLRKAQRSGVWCLRQLARTAARLLPDSQVPPSPPAVAKLMPPGRLREQTAAAAGGLSRKSQPCAPQGRPRCGGSRGRRSPRTPGCARDCVAQRMPGPQAGVPLVGSTPRALRLLPFAVSTPSRGKAFSRQYLEEHGRRLAARGGSTSALS